MNVVKALFFVIAAAVPAMGAVEKLSALGKNKTGIVFADGSSVYFKSDAVAAVSKQIYYLGAFRITEMVVDISASPSQIKIYNIQTASADDAKNAAAETAARAVADIAAPDFDYKAAQKRLEEIKKSADENNLAQKRLSAPARISKQFPSSTHSRTLEFCVGDIDDLLKLYDSFQKDFAMQGKNLSGACYKIINLIPDKK